MSAVHQEPRVTQQPSLCSFSTVCLCCLSGDVRVGVEVQKFLTSTGWFHLSQPLIHHPAFPLELAMAFVGLTKVNSLNGGGRLFPYGRAVFNRTSFTRLPGGDGGSAWQSWTTFSTRSHNMVLHLWPVEINQHKSGGKTSSVTESDGQSSQEETKKQNQKSLSFSWWRLCEFFTFYCIKHSHLWHKLNFFFLLFHTIVPDRSMYLPGELLLVCLMCKTFSQLNLKKKKKI